MARAPSTFRQQDVMRAVKAVTAAGVAIARVEIDKAGKITIITSSEERSSDREANEWDRVGSCRLTCRRLLIGMERRVSISAAVAMKAWRFQAFHGHQHSWPPTKPR